MDKRERTELPEEPDWIETSAGPEPWLWWLTRRYQRHAPRTVDRGHRFTATKHALPPEDEEP